MIILLHLTSTLLYTLHYSFPSAWNPDFIETSENFSLKISGKVSGDVHQTLISELESHFAMRLEGNYFIFERERAVQPRI